jgi:hypothetical protein
MQLGHIQDLATRYGPVLPCPPFLYGVVVGPGLHFLESGFAGDNEVMVSDERMYCLGMSIAPDDATMREWIQYPVDALLHGHDPSGGWSLGRSSVVAWGPDSQ